MTDGEIHGSGSETTRPVEWNDNGEALLRNKRVNPLTSLQGTMKRRNPAGASAFAR